MRDTLLVCDLRTDESSLMNRFDIFWKVDSPVKIQVFRVKTSVSQASCDIRARLNQMDGTVPSDTCYVLYCHLVASYDSDKDIAMELALKFKDISRYVESNAP